MARITVLVLLAALLAGCNAPEPEQPEIVPQEEPTQEYKFPLTLSGQGGEWVAVFQPLNGSADVGLRSGYDINISSEGKVHSFLRAPGYTRGTTESYQFASHYMTAGEGLQFGEGPLHLRRDVDEDGQYRAGFGDINGLMFMYGASAPWTITVQVAMEGVDLSRPMQIFRGFEASFAGAEWSVATDAPSVLTASGEIEDGWTIPHVRVASPPLVGSQTLGNGATRSLPMEDDPTETFSVFGHFDDRAGTASAQLTLTPSNLSATVGIVNFADADMVLPAGLVREQYQF